MQCAMSDVLRGGSDAEWVIDAVWKCVMQCGESDAVWGVMQCGE